MREKEGLVANNLKKNTHNCITDTVLRLSVVGVFLVLISRIIWTEYGPEKLQIRAFFTQCDLCVHFFKFKLCCKIYKYSHSTIHQIDFIPQ